MQSGPRSGGQPPATSGGREPGATIELDNVVYRDGAAAVSLVVPAGQSLAVGSQPRDAGAALFDVIAGLNRPRAGQVSVDGIAVDRLSGAELDRYRARRGLASPRFPLLPSLSAVDNVLAVPSAGRSGAALAQARRLLELTGASSLPGAVRQLPAEEQWRIMIARALMPSPRLLLAEDPASGLDARGADRILDVLLDAHAMFGFTLVLLADRPASAVRCQRWVSLSSGGVAADELTSDDDAWTRNRIDRIG